MDTQRSCRRWRVPSPPDLDPVPRRLPDPEEYGDRFHDALRKDARRVDEFDKSARLLAT